MATLRKDLLLFLILLGGTAMGTEAWSHNIRSYPHYTSVTLPQRGYPAVKLPRASSSLPDNHLIKKQRGRRALSPLGKEMSTKAAEDKRNIAKLLEEFLAYKKEQLDNIRAFPGDRKSVAWVKNQLQVLVNIATKARAVGEQLGQMALSKETESYVSKEVFPQIATKLWAEINAELWLLLAQYEWFTISKFGKTADYNGWFLVQHQISDPKLQKRVLQSLTKLYPRGETAGRHYAYLYDLVAVCERRPQKYGTVGWCGRNGRWELAPLADPAQVASVRKAVGLEPLAEFKVRVGAKCRKMVKH